MSLDGLIQKLARIREFDVVGCMGIFSSDGKVIFVNEGCEDGRPEFQVFGAQLAAGISHLLIPGAQISRFDRYNVTTIIETGEGSVYRMDLLTDKLALLILSTKTNYHRIAQFVPMIIDQIRQILNSP